MGQTCLIEIEGEKFELLTQRAVHWPARRTLIVADLHWGKGETFRKNGIPIPDALADDELKRLHRLLNEHQAERLVVLGDLIHAAIGMTPELIAKVDRWRSSFRGEWIVTRGNHDRAWKNLPASWSIRWEDQWDVDRFSFRHDVPEKKTKSFVWSGHLHPTFRLSSGSDSLRLPCFHFEPSWAVIPSFNFFTRGVEMKRGKNSRIFVATEKQIFEVGTQRSSLS